MSLLPAIRLPILTFVKVFKSLSASSRVVIFHIVSSPFINQGSTFLHVSLQRNVANFELKWVIAYFLFFPRKGSWRAANLNQHVT